MARPSKKDATADEMEAARQLAADWAAANPPQPPPDPLPVRMPKPAASKPAIEDWQRRKTESLKRASRRRRARIENTRAKARAETKQSEEQNKYDTDEWNRWLVFASDDDLQKEVAPLANALMPLLKNWGVSEKPPEYYEDVARLTLLAQRNDVRRELIAPHKQQDSDGTDLPQGLHKAISWLKFMEQDVSNKDSPETIDELLRAHLVLLDIFNTDEINGWLKANGLWVNTPEEIKAWLKANNLDEDVDDPFDGLDAIPDPPTEPTDPKC